MASGSGTYDWASVRQCPPSGNVVAVSEKVEDFAYLWTTERGDWVVLRVDPSEVGLPYNRLTHGALLIDEDDALAAAVVQRMVAEGLPIATHPE